VEPCYEDYVNMEDYRVDIKVRNNTILKRIEDAGYKTVGEFCRLNNIFKWVSRLGELIAMKESPLRSDGAFRPFVIKVADILNCDPLDLFTDTQLHAILKTNKRSIKVNEAEMRVMLESTESKQKLLEDIVSDEQLEKKVDKALHTLTMREEKVIQMRFGLGDYDRPHNLHEIAKEFGITGARVRQIEQNALRRLRHPLNKNGLREFLNHGD
jgi:DNA-directed RNA polymerase specialized sigma subunit